MAKLSDIIEEFIKDMFEDSEDNELEIQRNELANKFSCAPSHINYVLTTRFTTDKGYYIESKRGGGGYIRIRRVEIVEHQPLQKIINEKIGDSLTHDAANQIIDGLLELQVISERESKLMKVVVNDRTLKNCDIQYKNKLRADILRSLIMVVLS